MVSRSYRELARRYQTPLFLCLFPQFPHLCIASTHLGHRNSSRNSNSNIGSSLVTAAEISPSPPPGKTARKGLTRTLRASLAFLGTSLLALDGQPDTSTKCKSASEGAVGAVDGGGGGSARHGPGRKSGTMAGGSGGIQGPAVMAESPAAAAASPERPWRCGRGRTAPPKCVSGGASWTRLGSRCSAPAARPG